MAPPVAGCSVHGAGRSLASAGPALRSSAVAGPASALPTRCSLVFADLRVQPPSQEDATQSLAAKSLAEGVRVGSLRAYEHKLREHSSMSSLGRDGQVDERHARIAMRLEADVQIAAEKVALAKPVTELARAAVDKARAALEEGFEEVASSKEEVVADLVGQWEAALQIVGGVAANAASVRPVPAEDVPFLLAGGGGEDAAGERPMSRERDAAYAREAAEARRLLEDTRGGPSDADVARLQSATSLTAALEDRAAASRSSSARPPLAMVSTGLRSGLWSAPLTAQSRTPAGAGDRQGLTGGSRGGAMLLDGRPVDDADEEEGEVAPAAGGRAGRDRSASDRSQRRAADGGSGLLGTVARVFDAAAAASNAEQPAAKSAAKWDAGTWRPEETGAYKAMADRQRQRREREREREGAVKGAKPKRQQATGTATH